MEFMLENEPFYFYILFLQTVPDLYRRMSPLEDENSRK